MGDFFADPDQLRSITPHFEQLGEDVESALELLKAGITKEGKCWGSDAPGEQFEENYPQDETKDGSVGKGLKALESFAAALKATGDNITTVANKVQTQDEDNAAKIRKV